MYVNDNITFTRTGYNLVNQNKQEILNELKAAASKFDKEVDNIFTSRGFKKVQ